MKGIIEIIETIKSASPNLNPTEIYNEGWMARLLVYYSMKEELIFNSLNFKEIKKWTSEALLSSPFVGVKNKPESHTHADIVLGDFNVDYNISGLVKVDDNAQVFGVIEAKMGSPLSHKTTNADDYNQASRNIVCIAHNTNKNCKTFFLVLAPKSKGDKILRQIEKDLIIGQIKNRIEEHNKYNDEQKIVNGTEIINEANKCSTGIIYYEDWIEQFKEKPFYNFLSEFYEGCLRYNKITPYKIL